MVTLADTSILKLPSKSVCVEAVLPFATMFAPGIGNPPESNTFPVIFFWIKLALKTVVPVFETSLLSKSDTLSVVAAVES